MEKMKTQKWEGKNKKMVKTEKKLNIKSIKNVKKPKKI